MIYSVLPFIMSCFVCTSVTGTVIQQDSIKYMQILKYLNQHAKPSLENYRINDRLFYERISLFAGLIDEKNRSAWEDSVAIIEEEIFYEYSAEILGVGDKKLPKLTFDLPENTDPLSEKQITYICFSLTMNNCIIVETFQSDQILEEKNWNDQVRQKISHAYLFVFEGDSISEVYHDKVVR